MEAAAMRIATIVTVAVLCLAAAGIQTGVADDLAPPVAKVEPVRLEKHNDVRIDNYYWLNERDNPDVVAYLEAENAYTDAVMAHTRDLQEVLFEEIKGRIKQNDESVPYKLDDYYYYTRFEDGKEYPIYCRKRESLDADEEIMIDVNVLAAGSEFCRVRGNEVSAKQNILAYAIDTVGRRIYTIKFKNLDTGETLTDEIPAVAGGMAWANDNRTLFYSKQDPTTLRSYRIYKHVLGADASKDELVYEEKDDEFSCYVWKTKSKKYVFIGSFQTLSSEFRYLDADDPSGGFKVFLPREADHEYSVDHYKDKFYVRTNWEAKNFRLMETPVDHTDKSHWKVVIPAREDVLLTDFEIFEKYLVLEERKNGLIQIRFRQWDGGGEHYLDFGEPAYTAYISTNPDFKTTLFRYVYTSMTTPKSTYDYDMASRQKTLLKQDEVLGGFSSDDYVTERMYAPARDGVKVPISLVYRKDSRKAGGNPLLLYGYGSYGYSMDAKFSATRLSLLDRGFVYAIAHVRGGEEMGRWWYEDGKLLKKKNTFTDFIDCAEYLIAKGYTRSDMLYSAGGSAGGLLMGAVLNMRPDLFNGVIARVPFVDVVTTMLDESIPLTTAEFDEWGNPNEKAYYDYMLSYSPYDQVERKEYPNLLVTTSLHDSQVQYFEPAKWVAKLRAKKMDRNRLLLKTNMEAGHGGASGRYKRYRDAAFQWAFLLDLAGCTELIQ
jgi:oligopeptidase B